MAACLMLKKSNCKNCYKCIRHCPVKSIRFSGSQAHIMEEECILCGSCYVVCPQAAREVVSEMEVVQLWLRSGEQVYVSLAPSFAAAYPDIGIGGMQKALCQLGFAGVEETALGATMVKREYEALLEEGRDVVISSCCHSVNLLIQKYFPAALPYLANILSPMQAHCQALKADHPGAKTVFIGPCIAKKDEAAHCDMVDAVLTFEELNDWLSREKVDLQPQMDTTQNSRARYFPTTGGILKTMVQNAPGYTYLAVDGIENCIAALRDIESGRIHHCFVEMSSCAGSCVGGPVMSKLAKANPVQNYMAVAAYAGEQDFDVPQPPKEQLQKVFAYTETREKMPTEEQIQNILHQMGKFRPSQELNCGSCGYNTCREKAIAIFNGKAEISMCLPFLKDRAESFSDTVFKSSPNGLIVLNEQLEVQQINDAAMKIMNIRLATDILGDHVVRILDPTPFADVLEQQRDMPPQRQYLADYQRYVEQTVVYDSDAHLLVGILRDITDEETQREKREDISRQTVEVADKVVDKQMRIVQEIASLLGETAAETKIALTKLKESISDE